MQITNTRTKTALLVQIFCSSSANIHASSPGAYSVIQTKRICPITCNRTGVRVYLWEMRELSSSTFLNRIWVADTTLQARIWTHRVLRGSTVTSSPLAHLSTDHSASLAWKFWFPSSKTQLFVFFSHSCSSWNQLKLIKIPVFSKTYP